MISEFITSIAKPLISCTTAISMAIGTVFTGPAGEFTKLENKAMTINPAKAETEINLTLDLEAIEALVGDDLMLEDIPEIEGVYKDGKIDISATFYTFEDADTVRAAVSFSENLSDGYAIYIDTKGVAITPGLVDAAFQIVSVFDPDTTRKYDIYNRYFADNGMYLEWDTLLETDDEEIAEVFALVTNIVTDVAEILGSEENAKALADVMSPALKTIEKYFSETTVDGVKGYSLKMNGIQLFENSIESNKVMYTEEAANKMFDYILGLIDDVDYIKYIDILKEFIPELETLEIPANITNQQLALMIRNNLEPMREDFVSGYTSVITEFEESTYEVILTGKDENDVVPDEIEVQIAAMRPFLENSDIEAVIYEKDGAIIESAKLTVGDGKAVYGELEVVSGISKYDGVILGAENVVPFDKRVESEEIDNKLGYEDALLKGVSSIEIVWDSAMYLDENELYIYEPRFFVNYKSSLIESIKNDPAFALMDAETQALILGMYEDSDYEYKYCSSKAELIDNSVYLPLRQLMENAGYEVSWDGEARKAYVTVDGEKIEMTGVIVNDRTYVKVRDFEKLGATVDYEEEFYWQDAYNDFYKTCFATITFGAKQSADKDEATNMEACPECGMPFYDNRLGCSNTNCILY